MRTRSRLLLAPALAATLLLAACGGDDEATTTTTAAAADEIAFAEWTDEVNQLCRAADKEVEDLPEPEDEDDYAGLEDLAVETRRISREFIGDVSALGTPDRNADDAAAFLGTYEDLDAVFVDLRAAAADEDDDAINDAIAEGDEINATKNELAESLGLDDCWEPEEGADDGGDADEAALAEWQTETNDACAALNPQYNAINEMEPTDLASLRAYATGLNAFMTSTVAEFDRIGPPPGDTATAQELYDLLSDMQAAAQSIVDGVDAEDLDAATAAAEEFDALGEELNPVADELGVPNCGGF